MDESAGGLFRFEQNSYVEEREEETEEEGDVEVPVMLNCWDCARMETPVGFC